MIREWAKKYDTHRALPELVRLSHLKNFVVALNVDGTYFLSFNYSKIFSLK